jgi:isocitrate dehydrogenase
MGSAMTKILYTYTDEAPALATHSLLPVLRAFLAPAGIEVELRDISLSARIVTAFADRLPAEQRVPDELAELGRIALTPEANIVKLPNISASIPQLKSAIAELQLAGIGVPDFPDSPESDEERDARARYDRVKGSAVNPVLRQGNSDRRAPGSVKRFAQANPHPMGAWSPDSRTRVASMTDGDFRHTERSVTVATDSQLRIEHVAADGATRVLRDGIEAPAGTVIDAAVMRRTELRRFLADQVAEAGRTGLMLSVHLKATMMKVSDPIVFGHAVRAFLGSVMEEHAELLDRAGADPDDGVGAMIEALAKLPAEERDLVEAAIAAAFARGPGLAYVDSDRGISNLHVPSDVIVDASMPAMIRTSGQMWGADGQPGDTIAVIPDSSYAALYAETIEHCRTHGAFDPTTMGTVPNVGLMAQAAEEYGSHDTTFEMEAAGTVRVLDGGGQVLLVHEVAEGDIWRLCRTRDAAIRDWVRLSVERARLSGMPVVFWLDRTRAHDAELLAKVEDELGTLDTAGLDLRTLDVTEATRHTLARARAGKDTIAATGNVLRDYLTDLFPILELGTSAKMLSIVPLMAGGALFETGAGGSAPKHVQQLVKEGHLRWDSLGEFMAMVVSLEHVANRLGIARAQVLAETLDRAIGTLLTEGRSPARRVGEIDTRGSHASLAVFWARELAMQDADAELAAHFAPVADALAAADETILDELAAAQGAPVDIGGYYRPDPARADAIMRASATLNAIIDPLLG